MDVRLSFEQRALQSQAAQIVERHGPRSVVDLDDSERTARLKAAVDTSGWLGLRDRGDDDAPLASGVEVAVVAEELGRGLADVAYLGPTLAGELRRRAGAETSESNATVLLNQTLTWLASVPGTERPNGVALDARGASTAVVLVDDETAGTTRLGVVALKAPSVQLDLTRLSAEPDPTVAVATAETAGAVGDDDVAATVALGLAISCADLVGVMGGAIDLARDYAANRRQYGAPIGSYQAVQHMIADAFVAMEGSRSVALHAAWAVDALRPLEALSAAALAKAYCARSARTVCETCIQVHGGIGNTWDCLAHVYLRRALLSSELFGGSGPNLGRVLAHRGVVVDDGSGHGFR